MSANGNVSSYLPRRRSRFPPQASSGIQLVPPSSSSHDTLARTNNACQSLNMPGPTPWAPAHVRVYNPERDKQFKEHRAFYDKGSRTSCTRIHPERGEQFAISVALAPDFDFKYFTHLKISLYVGHQFIRSRYIECGARGYYAMIDLGAKFDPISGRNVLFALIVGDTVAPDSRDVDGMQTHSMPGLHSTC